MYIFLTLRSSSILGVEPGKDTYFCLIGTIFTLLICALILKLLCFKYMCVA